MYNIKRIFTQYWEILKQDLHLTNVIPDRPNMVFRKPRDLKSCIAPSRVRPLRKTKTISIWTSLFNQKGYYYCGVANCEACQFIWHRKNKLTGTDGKMHSIHQFINCGLQYVIYGLFYVGQTSHSLRIRFGDHKMDFPKGFDKLVCPNSL